MVTLHPEYLTKNGQKEFVVIPYDEFTHLKEYLEDMEDLLDLRNAKKADVNNKNISFDDVKQELGLWVIEAQAQFIDELAKQKLTGRIKK